MTGEAILNCVPEDTPDEMIFKELPIAGDIKPNWSWTEHW